MGTTPEEVVIYEARNGDAMHPLYEPQALQRAILTPNGWPDVDGFPSIRTGALLWTHREAGVVSMGFYLCRVGLQYTHSLIGRNRAVMLKAIGNSEDIQPVVNRFKVLEDLAFPREVAPG